MAQLSSTVLAELAAMDDYDRMLAFDRVGRQHNLTVEQVKAALQAYQQGGSTSVTMGEDLGERMAPETSESQPVGQAANYLSDAHKYRVRYDPSHEGQSRQANVEQAILCPHCGAPLGIPSIRPIKVTCPNCMNEATFHS